MASNTLNNQIVCSGALFYDRSSKRILLLQKASGKHAGTWGLVGGTTLEHENPWQGLQREIQEEIGFFPDIVKTLPIESFISTDSIFSFHTYLCVIDREFIPVLSSEHSGWAWSCFTAMPKPLHRGFRNSLSNRKICNKIQTIFDLAEFL